MEAKWDRPPEFEIDGTPPPVRTEPVEVEVGYRVRTADSTRPGDPLALQLLVADTHAADADFGGAFNWLAGQLETNQRHRIATRDNYRLSRAQREVVTASQSILVAALIGGAAALVSGVDWLTRALRISTYTGLLRWRYSTYWQRDDAIQQVSKNNSVKYLSSNTVGISDTRLHEVAQTLGLEVGLGNGAKLSSALTEKLATSVTFSSQNVSSREMTLSGPTGVGKYRYYALWRRRVRFEVDLLVVSDGTLHWQNELTTDYFVDDEVIVTDTESHIASGDPAGRTG